MPPENYRYYRLDGTGQLHLADGFHADNDEDAVQKITARYPDARCEIWQGRRLVAVIGAAQPFDVVASSRESIRRTQEVLRETASMLSPYRPSHCDSA